MKSYADDLPNEEAKPKRDGLFVLLLSLNLVVGVINVILNLS